MTDRVERFGKEIDELRAMRDELRVQMHLARAEAKESWEHLEKSWSHLEGRAKSIAEASREDGAKVADAARNVMKELRAGYEHLKGLL